MASLQHKARCGQALQLGGVGVEPHDQRGHLFVSAVPCPLNPFATENDHAGSRLRIARQNDVRLAESSQFLLGLGDEAEPVIVQQHQRQRSALVPRCGLLPMPDLPCSEAKVCRLDLQRLRVFHVPICPVRVGVHHYVVRLTLEAVGALPLMLPVMRPARP